MLRQCMAALLLMMICPSGGAAAADDETSPSVVNAPIQYPASAVSAREQGTTTVKALVNETGHVTDVIIDASSGHPDLDAAAVRSMTTWTFSPGTRNGKPEAHWVQVPITFQLKEAVGGGTDAHRYGLAVTSSLVGYLGLGVWLVGFAWSVVLAKRRSILWLSGMVALWAITYPLFVTTHWSVAKRNFLVVAVAFALLGISFYLPSTQG